MTFDKTDADGLWLSCTLLPEEHESSFDQEEADKNEKLLKLRTQIREGSYRPSIGEIAINLVKGTMNPDSFR
ncbi:hypothetical protein [Maridesulfovibrio hydrothermalis]|uniref:Anti-sigma-28 factor FlgM C-terminal domain-containing protein n=1 Tax=Maridesulfovibrio hydrothermalis AM13 = DSM 14728 TaxID=1121451 RepID=L0R9Y2_9BACT|nr:hypothetical protein [Maridesulfovibrio hydrothermalis]CCO22985.1 conserved protein of unknown function [Maridesulfovibrio hydrothermalis AM13 = DSM 14728]